MIRIFQAKPEAGLAFLLAILALLRCRAVSNEMLRPPSKLPTYEISS
jgi:hypothetical protein